MRRSSPAAADSGQRVALFTHGQLGSSCSHDKSNSTGGETSFLQLDGGEKCFLGVELKPFFSKY